MKKLLLSITALFSIVVAKAQFEEGHIYFDSAQTQLNEVYHYYLRYSYSIDYSHGDTVISPKTIAIRHGACIVYRKDGTIEATGQYKDGSKTGQWLFYDKTGKTVVKKENFG